MAEYIEREALVTEILGLTIMDSAVAAYADAVLYRIQHMPAKDVAPVVYGRWMGWTTSAYIGLDDVGEPKYADRSHFRCSKCRYGTVVKSAYCPNCGAKMEEAR